MDDFEKLLREALSNPKVRYAFKENALRRRLGAAFDEARKHQGLSVRALAAMMGTSASQENRLLHNEAGGSLTLSTLCRAADALDLSLSLNVRDSSSLPGVVCHLGSRAWTPTAMDEVKERVPARGLKERRYFAKAASDSKWSRTSAPDDIACASDGG
jgi:transcriptional regulator with XRE-family HTH domain